MAEAALLNLVGREFVQLRKTKGLSNAVAALQEGIMSNLGTISTSLASLEQCVSITLKIEEFRESKEAASKSVNQLLSEYLLGADDIKISDAD